MLRVPAFVVSKFSPLDPFHVQQDIGEQLLKVSLLLRRHSASRIAPIKTICHHAIHDLFFGFGAGWGVDCDAGRGDGAGG
jgi:hypothetical protein